MMFRNREEAAQQLAVNLNDYSTENPLILTIPGGGVEVGYNMALLLSGEFSVIAVHKLFYPDRKGVVFGSLAEDGSLYINPWAEQKLTRNQIYEVIKNTEPDLNRLVSLYRHDSELPSLKNRTVILVNDGIETGVNMFAAIQMCRNLEPGKLIVASPVAGSNMPGILNELVDEFTILHIPEEYYSLSQVYEEDKPVSNEDARRFVNYWRIRGELSDQMSFI